MRSLILHAAAASVFLLPASAQTPPDKDKLYSPAQLQEDLAVIGKTMKDSHPNIAFTVAPAALNTAMKKVSQQLDHPMTRDEAWRIFATLNPVLADAHTGIFYPSWSKEAKAYLAQGGRFFPYEVVATADGKLTVLSALGGGKTPLTGANIVSINGMDAQTVVKTLLDRVHGETPAFRAGLLSRRFWFFDWKMFGSKDAYDIVLDAHGKRRSLHVEGSTAVPVQLAGRTNFDQAFRFELLPCKAAVLTINTFDWPDKKKFLAFTHDAFAQIKVKGVKTLIIDIRQNEGGDDDMWMEGVMPYIATSSYRWASGYTKRVMEADPSTGEAVGDVVSASLDRWLKPDPANPLHFSGKTTVLIGKATYSSSILFTNVMQYFGFATIAGEGHLARADQTGGTRDTYLPNTGLDVGWPRFILYRPSGERTPEFVEPDIAIPDDPFHPRAAFARLTSCKSR
jgi:hypothetical protein